MSFLDLATFGANISHRKGNLFLAQGGAHTVPAFIGSTEVAGSGADNPIPVHIAGDLIMLISKRTGGAPGVHAGFATPANGTWESDPNILQFFLFEWVIDVNNTINTFIGNPGDVTACLVYRGCTVGTLAVAAFSGNFPVGSVSLNAPNLAASTPPSLMMFYFSTNNVLITGVTGGLTLRYAQGPLGGGDVKIYDTNALVTNAPASTASYAGNTFGTAQVIEIIPTA